MQMMMMPFQLLVVDDDIDDEKKFQWFIDMPVSVPDTVDVVALSLSWWCCRIPFLLRGSVEILQLQRVFYLLLSYYSSDQSPFVDWSCGALYSTKSPFVDWPNPNYIMQIKKSPPSLIKAVLTTKKRSQPCLVKRHISNSCQLV